MEDIHVVRVASGEASLTVSLSLLSRDKAAITLLNVNTTTLPSEDIIDIQLPEQWPDSCCVLAGRGGDSGGVWETSHWTGWRHLALLPEERQDRPGPLRTVCFHSVVTPALL